MVGLTYEAINTPSFLPLLSRSGPHDDHNKPEWARARVGSPMGVAQLEAAAALFKHLPQETKSEHIRHALNPEIIRPHHRTKEKLDIRVAEVLSRPAYLDHMADEDRIEFFEKSLAMLAREQGRPESYAQRAKLFERLRPYLQNPGHRHAETASRTPLRQTPARSNSDIGRELEDLIDPAIYREDKLARLKAVGEELDHILSTPLSRLRDRDQGIGR